MNGKMLLLSLMVCALMVQVFLFDPRVGALLLCLNVGVLLGFWVAARGKQ